MFILSFDIGEIYKGKYMSEMFNSVLDLNNKIKAIIY